MILPETMAMGTEQHPLDVTTCTHLRASSTDSYDTKVVHENNLYLCSQWMRCVSKCELLVTQMAQIWIFQNTLYGSDH